jgi:hypothetical protein
VVTKVLWEIILCVIKILDKEIFIIFKLGAYQAMVTSIF